MKKWLKSYLAFTSRFYRTAVCLLLPGGLIAVGFKWRNLGSAMAPALGAALICAEVVADNWLFGGIHKAGGIKLDYLRTSGRGPALLKRALVMDLARRFAAAALVYGAGCLLTETSGRGLGLELFAGIGFTLFGVLTSGLFAGLGIFFSRYGDMLWINMITGYGAAVLGILCWSLPGLLEYIWFYNLFFAVLGLLCGCLTVNTAMKKLEGSYYGK